MKGLKFLDIKKTEARPILMLIAYSFFMGLSIAFYFTATISDFLIHFDITILPYTYILSGILGYLLWLVWSYLEKKVQFTTRLKLGITFLFITVAFQGIGILYFYETWISFVMLVWVRVFIFVNMVNFWGMAGKLFNLSQAKRLFGIISVGTVISDIFGFFSIPFILMLDINNAGLILISLVTLIICLLITLQITMVFKVQLSEDFDEIVPMVKMSKKEPIFKNKYQLYLFLLAILPMFGFYFVDYLFLDQVQIEFKHSAEALAGFMGVFFGVVAIFELLIKTSVFSRLINNFGLKIALLALPGILLITVVLTISIGLTAGTYGFLFSMIAFIKLLEKILRSGINDPSFQILYQPIPAQERLSFQSKMEGVPSALGNIAAGGLILLLILFDLTNPILFNAIFFFVLLFWCYMTFVLQREYRNVILSNLSNLDGEEVTKLEENCINDQMQFSLVGPNVNNSKTLLDVLENNYLYEDRVLTLRKTGKYRLTNFIPYLENFRLRNSKDIDLSIYEDLSLNDSRQRILQSNSVNAKLNLLQFVKNAKNIDDCRNVIEKLILDKEYVVVETALSLIPKPLDEFFANLIVRSLESMELSYLATPILKDKNSYVEKLLVKKLQQLEPSLWSDLDAQLFSIQIIRILGFIGGIESQNYLVKLLNFHTSEVKYFLAMALDKSCYKAVDEESMFVELIEKEVSFCTWLLASMQDLSDFRRGTDKLIKCLGIEYGRATEKIFAFLSFIYSRITIQQIKSNLKAESTEKNVLGLEMCDMILGDTLKSILIPVFSNISNYERLKFLIKEFPQQKLLPIRRLEDIVYHNFTNVNTWIKISAMHILSENVKTVPRELFANLYIKNPAIKESSYLAIKEIDEEEFHRRIELEQNEFRVHFDKLLGSDPVLGKKNSIFENVIKLKSIPLFKSIHEVILVKFAATLVKIDLSESEFYCNDYDQSSYIHFVDKGSLRLINSKNKLKSDFKKKDVIGLFESLNLREVKFEATHGSQLLAVEAKYFFQMVSIYDELAEALREYCLKLDTEVLHA